MNKDLLKDIIKENQRIVSNVQFVERAYTFEENANYVLVGLRRAGKSYLLLQRIQQLLQAGHSIEEILYFNFEDDRLDSMSVGDLDSIKTAFEEMYDCKPIFFLDEIQIVEHWEKFARRLADQKYRVYITGSNAKMLSNEIATTLGGRFLIQEVYPFSFSEFLKAKGLNPSEKHFVVGNQSVIKREFDEYFHFGGLPEIASIHDKRSWLSNLYNKIFFGDILSRYQIRNDHALKILVKKLAESVKQPISYTRMANIVSSAGTKCSTDTAIDYVSYMHESWLLLPIENYYGSLQEKNSKRKYYFIDNGIVGLFLIDPNTTLIENMVAINLCKKYKDEVYYYNKEIEVDFYVPSKKMAIQVSYSLSDEVTRKREISALAKFAKYQEVDEFYIITKEELETIEIDKKIIQVIPIWKWLLT